MSSLEPAIATTARASWLLVIAAIVLNALAGLTNYPLAAPDEIRVAEVAREMAITGNLLVPRLLGAPFLEHPPLYYAAVAASFRLFGVSDVVARIPSAIATIALLLLVFDLGRRIAGRRAGALAVAVLASTLGTWRYGHDCMVDPWLSLFVAAGYWAYARLLLAEAAPDASAPTTWLLLSVYASAALAFLVKGPIGLLLVALPVLLHAVLTRRRALLLSPVHWLALPLCLAACAGWPALLYFRESPLAFDDWWQQNVLGRIVPDEDYSGGHIHGPLFYLHAFPSLALPWILALPFVARWLCALRSSAGAGHSPACRRTLGSLVSACVVGLVLLSAAGTKRELYVLPLLAPLSVLVAAWIATVAPVARKWLERAAVALFAASVVGLLLHGCFVDPEHDLTPMAKDLASMQVLDDTAGFQLSERVRATVPFRTGVELTEVQDAGELDQLLLRRPALKLLVESDAVRLLHPALAARLQPVRQWSFGRHDIGLYTVAAPANDEEPGRCAGTQK